MTRLYLRIKGSRGWPRPYIRMQPGPKFHPSQYFVIHFDRKNLVCVQLWNMAALNRAECHTGGRCAEHYQDVHFPSQHHLQLKYGVCMPATLPVKSCGCSLACGLSSERRPLLFLMRKPTYTPWCMCSLMNPHRLLRISALLLSWTQCKPQ